MVIVVYEVLDEVNEAPKNKQNLLKTSHREQGLEQGLMLPVLVEKHAH